MTYIRYAQYAINSEAIWFQKLIGIIQKSASSLWPYPEQQTKLMKNTPSTMTTTSEIATRGLIIRAEPLEKILSGKKSMELRKGNNKSRGPIALIQKSSGMIFGVADIGETVGPMTFSDFTANAHAHGVELERLRAVFDEGYVCGWKLSNIRRLKTPVPYTHKAGAVIWATLDDLAVAGLRRALSFL